MQALQQSLEQKGHMTAFSTLLKQMKHLKISSRLAFWGSFDSSAKLKKADSIALFEF